MILRNTKALNTRTICFLSLAYVSVPLLVAGEALRTEAEKFMASFEQFFNGLLVIGMTFEQAKEHITNAAEQHYIEVDIVTAGDSEIEWEWKFTLRDTETEK